MELVRALASLPEIELRLYGRGPQPGCVSGASWVALGARGRTAVWRETRLGPALAADGADVLWSPVAAIPLRTSVPVVATVHEVPWLVRPGLEGRLRGGVHALRLRVAAARAARIVCPSEATRAQVETCHPASRSRLRVVPHGVGRRFSEVTRRAEEGSGFWLHVGGARARKNLPMLIRSYVRYREGGGGAALRLVGPGAGPVDLPRGVSWLGYVDEETLLAMYSGARGLIVASEAEGFGLPVLEAMAAGCPVVACAAGGLVEAAGGAAHLVPPGDAEALAAALRALDCGDRAGDVERGRARRAELARAGRQRAAGATWSRSAESLVAVLAEVTGERS